jgi:molecular chaperone Hsp33
MAGEERTLAGTPALAAASEPLARGLLALGTAGGGGLRWAFADLTAVVEAARVRLDASPVAAAALGRVMAGAALLLRLAPRTPNRLLLEVKGDGPLGQVLAEADDQGGLRGTVAQRCVELPRRTDGKLPIGEAVGARGTLRVRREYAGGSYHSEVELVSGEIAKDLVHYLEQSEQTQSAVLLGVLARPAGVSAAGGMIVEVVPGAEEEVLATLEGNLAAVASFSRLLGDAGAEGVVAQVLAGLEPETRERRELAYRCRCNRARLQRYLAALAAADAEALFAGEETVSADCAFCGAHYTFERSEMGLG